MTSTENKIAFARQYYNDTVMTYNTKQELFPANLFAASLGFKKEEYYQVPEEEKENVKVDLR